LLSPPTYTQPCLYPRSEDYYMKGGEYPVRHRQKPNRRSGCSDRRRSQKCFVLMLAPPLFRFRNNATSRLALLYNCQPHPSAPPYLRLHCPLCCSNITGGILHAEVFKASLEMCLESLDYPGLYLSYPFP
jgi:hypothetical protein